MIRWLFAILLASSAMIGKPTPIMADGSSCALTAYEEEALTAASYRHGVPLDVLHAVAWVESRCNANAKGGSGEIGMFQVMPSEYGYFDRPPAHALWDVKSNALEAARILRENKDRYCGKYERLNGESWKCPLAVYNAGTLVFFTGYLTPRGAWYADLVLAARPEQALVKFIVRSEP